jgi:hypothetical protein
MLNALFHTFHQSAGERNGIALKKFWIGCRHRLPEGAPRTWLASPTAYWSTPGASSIVNVFNQELCRESRVS